MVAKIEIVMPLAEDAAGDMSDSMSAVGEFVAAVRKQIHSMSAEGASVSLRISNQRKGGEQ